METAVYKLFICDQKIKILKKLISYQPQIFFFIVSDVALCVKSEKRPYIQWELLAHKLLKFTDKYNMHYSRLSCHFFFLFLFILGSNDINTNSINGKINIICINNNGDKNNTLINITNLPFSPHAHLQQYYAAQDKYKPPLE